MAQKKLDRRELIEQIELSQGVISLVSQRLDVSRQAIYDACRRWPSVKKALDDARAMYKSGLCDEAELALRASVRKEKPWAIRYALDNHGQSRGYGKQVDHAVTGEITFRVVRDR